MVPSLPLLPCELSVSVKENPDRKKNILQKIMNKHFNKNLMKIEEEEHFQSSNTCWILKGSLIMTMKKLEIIVMPLKNLEGHLIGVVA